MCLRACRSSARFATEQTVPSKDPPYPSPGLQLGRLLHPCPVAKSQERPNRAPQGASKTGAIFGPHVFSLFNFLEQLFVTCSLFFVLGGDLGEAVFLKDLPSEIADFEGPGVQEPYRFGSLGSLLGNFWGCLGAPCRCLAAFWAKRFEKGRPRAAQESPKEH